MNRSKKSIFLLLLPLFIILLSIGSYIIHLNQSEKIGIALQKNLSNLEINYQMLIYNQKIRTKSLVDSIFNEDKIKEIIIEANNVNNSDKLKILKDKLFTILEPRYKKLLKEGVLEFHIVLSNNNTFLRMGKTEKYNNLSEVRKDMRWVYNNKKALFGFDIKRTSHNFKNIIPLFNENRYLGLVDIAYGSDTIQSYFNNINKINTHFLVKKSLFSKKGLNDDKIKNYYIKSYEHKDYMVNITKKSNIEKYKNIIKLTPKLKAKISKKIDENKKFAIFFNNNNHKKVNVIVAYPIKNTITNEITAWLISYEKDNNIIFYEKDKNIMFIILIVILVVILIVIYRIIRQKEILNELVEQKTLTLSNINNKLINSESKLRSLNINLKSTIEKEVLKNVKVQKELLKTQQLASMGEMIGNIAHQWRQPLSVITTQATSMIIQKECNILDDKVLLKSCKSINDNAKYLSKTIDDFRNFVKGDKEKERFLLSNNMKSLLSLVSPVIRDNNIYLITDFDDDIELINYPNELNQCLINIVNNAKDALINANNNKRYIFINTYIYDNKVHIRIKDNANGIKEDILNKIFDPYFTTKHKSQGTGLGLNMVYNMVTKHLNGNVISRNCEFNFKSKKYKGAEFIISLPLK